MKELLEILVCRANTGVRIVIRPQNDDAADGMKIPKTAKIEISKLGVFSGLSETSMQKVMNLSNSIKEGLVGDLLNGLRAGRARIEPYAP